MKTMQFIASLAIGLLVIESCTEELSSTNYGTELTTLKSYNINSTALKVCYGNYGKIPAPAKSEDFYGQDAQNESTSMAFTDNGDGTITDKNTGLTWIKARGMKMSWEDAFTSAKACTTGGYSDWRVPTIKELYSIINFNGHSGYSAETSVAYIDTKYFDIAFGNTAAGERLIDAQDWSATEYVGTTMHNDATVFGFNFIDGRIKGYPKYNPGTTTPHTLYVRFVRGNKLYGINNFVDNGNNTISDNATGLMWSKNDSGKGMNWKDALAWVQQKNNENYLGFSDWRLPNAKELQSIVDYSKAPDITNSPAINPVFNCSKITNEGGNIDYPYFWTSTTHLEGMTQGQLAIYICFGRGLGFMTPPYGGTATLLDVHGAGCQRSDFKSGSESDYPTGHGPQGDVVRILNYIRLVRTIK